MDTKEILKESQRWLDIISTPDFSEEQKAKIVADTVDNFSFYYNRGYLDYRKSVIEMRDSPALEWEGQGSMFRDIMGREFIDCLGGYGIYSAGIRHPKIVKAVADQLARMPLSSQELLDPLRGALAELLGEIAPGDLQYSFFINNGTDAIEGAIKLARLFTGKSNFISSLRGFHGKSCGSLSLLGKWEYREPFLPLLPGIQFVEFGDADAVIDELYKSDATSKGVAAVIMEPVQGEAGAIVPPDDFWPRIRKACDEYGALLIADEVQTGLGRTGKMFGVEHWKTVPDIMCLGKALGGGVMPLSAFISTPKIWNVLETNPFIHTSTFGGNPLACAAGIAAVNVTLEEDLPAQAARKGKYFLGQLIALQLTYDRIIRKARGKGLLLGLEFANTVIGYKVVSGLFKRGVLVAGTLTNSKVVRIEPALNIPDPLIDKVLDALEETLKEVDQTTPDITPDSDE
ncbi:MAG TPA: aminotransferase class III-fold pyridoxal phosphate-dependent enzyme [Thermoanaerobaculia bacterium]|nr:aminotransferase class III-fold pyridoxal phosphate-dependent enzyme [Thermoanaerobaculia bacterium]